MGIKIGNLAVAKKVKRIYVGVDGSARRVTKVYGKQGIVYEDNEILQQPIVFNMGNLTPTLCTAVVDPNTNEYVFTGTFKDKFTLSEIRAAIGPGTVTDTGRSISLGSSTKPYNMPVHVAPYGSAYASDARFFFSGSALGNIYIKRIKPVGMIEESGSSSGTSLWTIKNSKYQTLTSGIQDIDSYSAVNTEWPFKGAGLKLINLSSSGIVLTSTQTGGDNPETATAILSGYTSSQNTIRYQGYDFYRKMLVTGSAAGNSPKLIALFHDSGKGVSNYSVYNTYAPSMPDGLSATNLFFGSAHVGQAKDSSGSSAADSYMVTMSYQDGSKRYSKLIVDSGEYELDTVNLTDRITFDVREYTEFCDLPADSSLSAQYKWHVLGADGKNVYVLSTMGGSVKVIRFSITTGQLIKEKEYDTGIELDGSVVVHQPVPVQYASYSDSEAEGKAFLTAFVVTRNNEYNEIVVVPRNLLD